MAQQQGVVYQQVCAAQGWCTLRIVPTLVPEIKSANTSVLVPEATTTPVLVSETIRPAVITPNLHLMPKTDRLTVPLHLGSLTSTVTTKNPVITIKPRDTDRKARIDSAMLNAKIRK